MPKWKRLDMSRADGHPEAGCLTALRLIPSRGRTAYLGRVRYDVGTFKRDERSDSRKLWWHGDRGVEDVGGMKKHYDIWWLPVAEFDGGNVL
ncbi:hypothetical protein [uncultured Oscillibacter sp.]|uniref:hypothetical protein n=1 Tax=uncultured Oscillibacter sp. TaxID=876091 RepID=UPI0025EB1719|nr:hypothetical protein [uncultured Oscillibacter sp.]